MIKHRFVRGLLCFGLMLFATGVVAQEKVGTIIMAHGASEEWNQLVRDAAANAKTGGPIEVGYLMGPAAKTNPFQAIAARMEQQGVTRIVVVPLLISSHSGHYEQIRFLAGATDSLDAVMQHHLHMGGLARAQTKVPLTVTAALDDSPELADILSERARSLTSSAADHALYIVGHGPNSFTESAHWMSALRTTADRVARATQFKDVKVGLVQDDAPAHVRAEAVLRVRETIELQNKLTGKPVIVVPVLISKGKLSHEKLPVDLKGLDIVYTGDPLLPHPAVTKWIERSAKAPLREAPR